MRSVILLRMSVNPLRVKQLSEKEYTGKTVVYQMCRDIRAKDNDALLFAQELALTTKSPLVVNYVIYNYKWEGATRRFYDWVLPSLQEVEEVLRKHSIPLVITFENNNIFKNPTLKPVPETIGAVVVDQLPLHFANKWKSNFLSHAKHVALYEVDAHNCIPVWGTSQKQEFAARTIRGKVHAKLPAFLEEHGSLKKHTPNEKILANFKEVNWKDVASKIICNESVSGLGDFVPGEKAAQKALTHFLTHGLLNYDTTRNDIATQGQSNLSPYIAHGNISRRRIILELLKKTETKIQDAFDPVQNGSNGKMGSVSAFIEECVVRAELSDNFCYYNKKYNKTSGFPDWAKETLRIARTDKREYVYTRKEFEEAKTHDELWNAAQMQMVRSGKMHGYLRMYWAKKILEWTATPEDALTIAIYLNDTYELDGRDPNGYVGCAWSIGGVHDRPWFKRLIFGAIRYMAYSGVEKRGDVSHYIKTWK